ncbi:MAG: HIT family protein [Bacteroidia bacterium]
MVAGEIPSYKVAEDDNYLAFLDVQPLAVGHVLVIPKQEVDYIFDVDDDLYTGLWAFAKKVAKGLERAISCERIGIAVVGLEVPHAHIHLIPLQKFGTINFSKPKMKVTQEEMAETAAKIRARLQ